MKSWASCAPTTGRPTPVSLCSIACALTALTLIVHGCPPIPPVLSVTPTTLDFGATTNSLTLEITNAGLGTLDWSISNLPAWATASATSGTGNATVTITVDRTGLSDGAYSQDISITSNGGNASVTLTMTVGAVAGPLLSVSPLTLDFGATTNSLTLQIANAGVGSLDWSISNLPAWVTASTTSGTGDATVTITVDRTGLSNGAYSQDISITSNGGNASVTLQMTVSGAAVSALGIIAFTTDRDGNDEIYLMNADGTEQTNWTRTPNFFEWGPAWSPDGTKVAFVSDRDGNPDIWVLDWVSSTQANLTNNPAIDADPDWSPDGTKIAFASDRDGDVEIYLMNPDGTGQTNLTNTPDAFDFSPAWSPDGTKIAFSSDRDLNFEIYVMNADGTGQAQRTNNNAWNDFADWSPDGTKIAFTSDRSGDPDIWVMNADGTGQANLTNSLGPVEFEPAWSPDGGKLAFSRLEGFGPLLFPPLRPPLGGPASRQVPGQADIYVMNADGTGQANLTNTPDALEGTPAWWPGVLAPGSGSIGAIIEGVRQ